MEGSQIQSNLFNFALNLYRLSAYSARTSFGWMRWASKGRGRIVVGTVIDYGCHHYSLFTSNSSGSGSSRSPNNAPIRNTHAYVAFPILPAIEHGAELYFVISKAEGAISYIILLYEWKDRYSSDAPNKGIRDGVCVCVCQCFRIESPKP